MALQNFPTTIRVTLGSAWNGRFGLSNGTVIDLIQGSCSPASCQWSEDGTTQFNKTTNRIMVTWNNNINFPYPHTPTGTYGTAQAVVYAGKSFYSTPTSGQMYQNWKFRQRQYTFNGFSISNYYWKEMFSIASSTSGPNGSISQYFTGSAGTNNNDSGQNFYTSFTNFNGGIFTSIEMAPSVQESVSDGEGAGTGHGEAAADGAHTGLAEAPGTGHGEASASGDHVGTAEGSGSGPGEAVSLKNVLDASVEGGGSGPGEAASVMGLTAAAEGGGQGAGEAASLVFKISNVDGGGTGHGEAVSVKGAIAGAEGAGTGHGEAVGLTADSSDSEGTGTGHGEAAAAGAHVGAGEGSGAGHGEATAVSNRVSAGEGTGTGHGSYASIPGGAGNTKVTAQGHGEAVSVAALVSAGEGSGQGAGEAVSVANVAADAKGPGSGHGEATSTKAVSVSAEGTGTGHGENAGVSSSQNDAQGTGQGHGEAASVALRAMDGEGSGQGAGEAVSVKGRDGAAEGAGQGTIEATSVKGVIAGAAGTGAGHGKVKALRTANTKVTGQGHGEAETFSAHNSDVAGTGRGGGVAITASTHPAGLQSIGVDQPPSGALSNFPFIKPSDDIKRMLGDFYLSYEDPECIFALPFRVAWLAKFGEVVVPNFPGRPAPVNIYDLIVEDANGLVVFDSTTSIDFVVIPFSDRLEAVEWKTDKAVCRVVRHIKSKVGQPPLIFDRFIEPEQSDLDVITYRQVPERVRSIRVGLVTLPIGDIIWDEGFNFSMTALEPVTRDGGRFIRPIAMSALPGDGLGRVPGCEDVEPLVRRINNVGPDGDGGFLLDADGCYRVQRPTELVSENPRTVELRHPDLTDEEAAAALHLFNDCGPCCECDDFVNTYKGLRKVFFRYEELGERAEDVRDQYAINKARWEEELACRFVRPSRIVLAQEFDCTIAVGGMHCNNTDECITPIILRFTFQAFKDGEPDPSVIGGSFICEETRRKGSDTNQNEIPFQFEGSYPVLDALFDTVNAHDTSRVRTRLQIPGCLNGQALRVTLTTHAPDFPEGSDASFPEVSVPTDISDLWDSSGATPEFPARSIVQKSISLNPVEACRT